LGWNNLTKPMNGMITSILLLVAVELKITFLLFLRFICFDFKYFVRSKSSYQSNDNFFLPDNGCLNDRFDNAYNAVQSQVGKALQFS